MNPSLKKLIDGKREWTKPLSSANKEKGFKGWYASKNLPHFDSPEKKQFITYRLADSMPAHLRSEWEAFLHLEDELEKRKRIEEYIDRGLGACHLRNPLVADVVQENLWHHDGDKYQLLAWVIMPNHVHALIEMRETPLGKILQSWKGYTGHEINKMLGREGALWADDYFDRYIRDEKHFWRVLRYIENNPLTAGLVKAPEEWLWSSARFRSKDDLSAQALLHPKGKRNPPQP